ncbi:MAG TPA: helix-turn-helix domain-containing protein [Microlunatus sp.]|nr:helix-turn-helix domain-containing protein [Microlunatus sp.]
MHRDHPWPGVVSAVGYRTPEPDHPIHRGLPSPWLTVIFSLDEGVESASTLDELASAQPTPIVTAGLHTETSYVLERTGQTGIQLAVHPLAARTLLGRPAAELSATEYDGAEVVGRTGERTQQRLTDTPDWSRAFDLLRDHLRQTRDDHRRAEVRTEVRHAWHLLEASGGQLPIAVVAAQVGVTPRHLGTLFRREVGRPPKTIAQLIRFQRAVTLIKGSLGRTGRVDLAEVAATAGYADQSHLTHEFVDRIGIPPSTWISEEFRNLQDHGRVAEADSST